MLLFTSTHSVTSACCHLVTYTSRAAHLKSKIGSVYVFPFNKEAAQVSHHILGGEGRWISWKGPPLSEECEILGRWLWRAADALGSKVLPPVHEILALGRRSWRQFWKLGSTEVCDVLEGSTSLCSLGCGFSHPLLSQLKGKHSCALHSYSVLF